MCYPYLIVPKSPEYYLSGEFPRQLEEHARIYTQIIEWKKAGYTNIDQWIKSAGEDSYVLR